VRLNAYLARAGIASRRGADELIKAGRVTVNGEPGQLNTFVERRDRVEVDGEPVSAQELTYVLLHKPAGTVTTARDPQGRPTVVELVDVPDGVDELVGGERLHQELARAGEHRAAEVVLLALDAHHDDRRLGDGVRDDLRRRDPVHVGHVDVHEDHVRPVLLGHVDGFLPAAGGSGDLHVGLEPDQLREVLSRVGDVVDNEDADLFAVSQVASLPFAVSARV